jgi:predicted membrane protein
MRRIKAEIVVIVLLWIYAIIPLFSNQYFSIQFKIGIAGLVISTLFVIRFSKIVFYLLSLLLLFSVFDLITFSQTNFYIGLNNFRIILLPTILLIYLCFKRRDIIREWFAENEDSRKENEDSRKRKILMFKKEFQNYSVNDIEKKLEADNLVVEARSALIELLDEIRSN